MSNHEILGESLPLDETIEVPAWKGPRTDAASYKVLHAESVAHARERWESLAKELEWFKSWDSVVSLGEHPHIYKWFSGGTLNISNLALDRHVRNWRGNKVALIWEGEPTDETGAPKEVRKITYAELLREVNKLAFALRTNYGLKKGDKVAIYLPLIPEAIVALLAAARLGVTFTAVFSGFSADSLSSRINDLGASLLITADGFYRRGRHVLLKNIADAALAQSPSVKHVIVVKRLGVACPMQAGRDSFLGDVLGGLPMGAAVEPEPVESEHPLYVLYTSGTTGKPKGIIHDTGGYAVLLHATMKWAFDIREQDVYWCPADIGWVTGHSYIAFGPLIEGATVVLYEGALDAPQPDRWWSIAERYAVSVLYTTPTATRAQIRFGDENVTRHDLSSLRLIQSVGEAINPSAWRWLFDLVGRGRCPVGSTWWMTETGGILISLIPGLAMVPMKAGSNGFPIPGVDADVVDEKGDSVAPGEKGLLVLKNPWPGMPGPPTGMYGDPARYERVYYERFPGTNMFFCGDYAVKDRDGYIWVAGRADEVLKVAGHRIGTYELESAIVSHHAASEAAVVGVPDAIKGETPIAFVVLKYGFSPTEDLRGEVRMWVRERFSPIAEPSKVFFVTKLPKTRSGKIMRRLLRAVAEGKPLGDVATLEDEASVDEARRASEGMELR
ncbi:MAG: acetate--CoA ligase [Nitrososphaerales archaeon]